MLQTCIDCEARESHNACCYSLHLIVRRSYKWIHVRQQLIQVLMARLKFNWSGTTSILFVQIGLIIIETRETSQIERKKEVMEWRGREQWFFNVGRTRGPTYYNLVSTRGMLINLKKQLSSLTRRYKRETSFQLFKFIIKLVPSPRFSLFALKAYIRSFYLNLNKYCIR